MVSGNMHKKIEKLHRKYGPAVRVGPDHLALDGSIAWPEVFKFKKGGAEFGKVENYLFENDKLGIIAAPKDVHRRQRRQLSHAFSDAALREQEAVINKYLDLLIQCLTEKSASNESFNIVDWLNFLTFDIIGHLTYSESFHCLDDKGYHPWVLQFFDGVRGESYRRFFSAFPFAKEIVTAFNLNDSMKKGNDHKSYIVEKAAERMHKDDDADKGYRDFMTYMLRKNSDGVLGFTKKEIFATMPLIIGAGSETTAATMSALIFYLGTHPNVYKNLIGEIRSTFAREEDITLKSTRQLKYLHACLEETLRIYPPVNETPPRRCPGATITERYVPAEASRCLSSNMSTLLT
ncbi:hypothetical protein TARUN_10052 [Trichoderma arundinaceum]|uniref:Cytochrome p450 n=1 Tax=Trichoderma arundinaceum TaxID=490622 RepID=A0A395N7W3_TRIAR|nr:hypothetical protein TARUN_10052 [Trichoderma arundinaceum]